MGRGFKVFLLLVFVVSLLPAQAQAAISPARLLITEVKIGGQIDGQPTEFLQIYNHSEEDAVLENVLVEYAKPAADIVDCSAEWKTQDSSSSVKHVSLEGVLPSKQSLVIEMNMNDNAGGSLHILEGATVHDTVGWGVSVSQGVCFEEAHAEVPEKGKSIKRYVDVNGEFVDSKDNSEDFVVIGGSLTGPFPILEFNDEFDVCVNLDGAQDEIPEGYVMTDENCMPTQQEEVAGCEVLALSEILPNPEGSDSGSEYIELYNPTNKTISLEDCGLKVGSSRKDLEGDIYPGYMVFYGLTLPNAAGGQVEFVSPATEEVVIYPPDLSDNEAWALVGGVWQITNQPTPNAENALSVVAVDQVSEDTLEPCPEGKFRNPETNRCKTIETNEGLKPCAPDQYRNPETNRCKKKADTLTELKPCDPGQYRNPETNRCRKISSDGSDLKPCDEGEERNPETNRCRKVAGVSTDVPSETNKSAPNINYILIGLFASTAVLYGIYEYRDSIGNYFARLKSKATK